MTQYGCHNRPHYRASMDVQDGWNSNGTRRMKSIPVQFNPDCQYDLRETDTRCAGCRWATGDAAWFTSGST